MSVSRLLSGRPSKRARLSASRISVASTSSTQGVPSISTQIAYREQRIQRSTGRTFQSEPISVVSDPSLPRDDSEFGLEENGNPNDEALEADYAAAEQAAKDRSSQKKKKKRVRSLASARPMVLWKKAFRDIYLDEMLRLEGRGDSWCKGEASCYDCRAFKAEHPECGKYRCQECFYPQLLCKNCCVKRHRNHPFHVIEEWTGDSFVKSSLKELGLRIQLNHLGNACSKPVPAHASFTIIHTNGLHEVALDFCGCRPVTKLRQLLRRGLYPSSQDNPRTCATFILLRQMHLLSLTSKCSTYDYYRAMEKLTNNTGIKLPRSKYRPLLRMILQWRHLKLLKRGGRGHDATGAAGTKEGELAMLCPSCPHPGINLPDDWRNAPHAERFLYFVILCIDANFRLKNQLVSNYSVDPGLGIGMSYMVERESFEAYVRSRVDDVDMTASLYYILILHVLMTGEQGSDKEKCGLQAVEQASTKFSKGLRYTGVSSVSCGRSEMIMPCSVGNLEKGEKYCVMDYATASAIRFVCAVLCIILSYDIACQWFVNFASRVADYWPEELKPPDTITFTPLIPKLHEKGHKRLENHEQFSFNFCNGVGHTDGECPERIWSAHNALGNATKTMGPGSRHDVLDDHFGHWNHEKYVAMGRTLMRRYQKALPERNRQAEAHRGFTASLKPEDVKEWTDLCEKWGNGGFPRAVENPYNVEGANITMQQAKKELADEEKKQQSEGAVVLHEMTPLRFVTKALDIEDSQRRLRWIVKHKLKDAAALTQECQSLRKEIDAWRRVQPIYMPGLEQYLCDQEKSKPGSMDDSEKAEDMRLWLPSSLPSANRGRICHRGIPTIEEKLRTAQCHDALRGICNTLRLKSRMVHFKNKNVRGQRDGTRSRELINRVHNRARKFASRYRAARSAKYNLSGPGDWETTLQVLHDSDIRSPQDPERIKAKKRRRGTYEDSELAAGMDAGLDEGQDDGEGINLLPEERSKRDGSGQTRMEISWIWRVIPHNEAAGDARVDSVLRAEWSRSHARVQRATEEVQLLREEMRRVMAFLDWKANWWRDRSTARAVGEADLAEGLRAYCVTQANHQLALKASFQALWKNPLKDCSPSPSNPSEASDRAGETDDLGINGKISIGNDSDNSDGDEDSDDDENSDFETDNSDNEDGEAEEADEDGDNE